MTPLALAPFLQSDVAGAVTAVAAVLALLYARHQIAVVREGARIDLAFRLYEHQLNPAFARHIALAADFITIDTEDGDGRKRTAERRWRSWGRMNRAHKAEILLYLNHLEVVGNLYEMGRIDRDATMEFFGSAASTYWKRGDWFIRHIQEESPTSFTGWGKLAATYEAWRPPAGRRARSENR